MIKSIKKVSEGKYVINDCIFISDINVVYGKVSCDISFDPALTTEKEAHDLAEQFVVEALSKLV